MPIKVGILGVAHVHTPSYARCLAADPAASYVGASDHDAGRAAEFCKTYGGNALSEADLIASSDAVVICSENVYHEELAMKAFAARKHVLSEKPLSTTVASAELMVESAAKAGVLLMTGFPCPFSPAFQSAVRRINAGEIGKVLAMSTTNRGTCPFGWFTNPELSGGGALIDHVVHVADLLRRIKGQTPTSVSASVSSNIYGQSWEDCAMLTLNFADGTFATLDSSWSRPTSYHTWGDVTLNIVGTEGLIELDLFGSSVHAYNPGDKTHISHSYVSSLDGMMVREFLDAISEGRAPMVTGQDGLEAVRVAEMAYASLQ